MGVDGGEVTIKFEPQAGKEMSKTDLLHQLGEKFGNKPVVVENFSLGKKGNGENVWVREGREPEKAGSLIIHDAGEGNGFDLEWQIQSGEADPKLKVVNVHAENFVVKNEEEVPDTNSLSFIYERNSGLLRLIRITENKPEN